MTPLPSIDARAGAVLAVELDHFATLLTPASPDAARVLARLDGLLREFAGDAADAVCDGPPGRAPYWVVLDRATTDAPLAFAQRLVERIAATDFAAPGAPPLWLTASVGVGLRETSVTIERARRAAEVALHVAQDAAGNCAVELGPDDPRVLERLDEVHVLPAILAAIREGRLRLDCQPVVPLAAAGPLPAAASVVVRLETGTGEVLDARRFGPVAARHRCTSRLDRDVFARVCRWLESRADARVDLDFVLVPVHVESLADPEFVDALCARLDSAAFPRRRLCIEVTGNRTADALARHAGTLERVRALGARVALDDFGCTAASLAQHLALAVDLVRVDAAMLSGPRGAEAGGLLAALRDLCRAADRRTIVGQCGTPALLDAVRRLGMDYAQGDAVCESFPLDRLLPPRVVSAA